MLDSQFDSLFTLRKMWSAMLGKVPFTRLTRTLSVLFTLLIFCSNPALAGADLKLEGDFIQGGLVRGKVDPQTRVYYQEQMIKLSPGGDFVIGFGRDAESTHRLTLVEPSGETIEKQLQVGQRNYKVQYIDGISKKMMDPDEDDLARIRQESSQVKSARKIDSDLDYFSEPFIWPLTGRITGVYGSQRILNGEPRRPHFGIDIAAPTGTAIKAPAGGVVTLTHEGMFFSGKTLIIDHGHGLSSSFLHLNSIHVTEGEKVRQGDIIAEVGATGRVTGPHLDWRINWFEQRLDPALLVPKMPEQ